MAIRIGSNIGSQLAQRRLGEATGSVVKSSEQLSSGLRINRASDDAAGLAIADTLNASSRIFNQAVRNVNDGQSVLSIAQGALQELSGISTRQIELSAQAANGVYTTRQRTALDAEASALTDEFNRVVNTTTFNGQKVFQPSTDLILQIGSGNESTLTVKVGQDLARNTGTNQFVLGASAHGQHNHLPLSRKPLRTQHLQGIY